jgi:C4-dicarboxylate transporter DctQ subunit
MKFLDHLEEWLIATLMAVATLITFFAVVHRYGSGIESLQPYLAHIHTSWAQELTIYLFVWMAKFGAAYGVRTGIHVGVDVLINKLSDKNRSKFIVIGLLAGALFTVIVGTLGATFVWEIAHTDQTSADLEMPMWIVYLAVPLGSYLMCFRFLQVLATFLRTGEMPHQDETQVEGLDDDHDDLFAAAHPVPQGGAK